MDTKYVRKPLPALPALSSFSKLLKMLQTKQEAFFFKEALELYIPPQVGRYVGDEEPKDAAQAIGVWLNSPDKRCLLLLGDSGAGKTLFGQWLTRQSFGNQQLQGRIPLFIPLLAQNHPERDLIDHYLKKTCKITDENQREIIKQQKLLLILDGFDEIHQKINLYRSNQLWQLKDAKILISCRSQALENIHDYGSLFYPCDSHSKPQPDQLQEFVVNPFNEKQIDAYLQQYVNTHQAEIKESHPDWIQWQVYQAHIQKLPGLQALLISPFVLSIVVQVLPKIIAKHQGKESIEQLHLARINLYDHFVEQWFAHQKQKLLNARHISDNCPIEELFIKCSKGIANTMLQNNQTSIELTLNTVSPLLAQQGFFGEAKSNFQADSKNPELKYVDEEIIINGEKIRLSLVLSGCPVMKLQDNQYAFLHKSLLEYFAARKLFEGVMADASIALGYELNERLLTDEPATLHFLAERVEQDDKLQQRLFDVLEESKFDERVEVAAANAITILNYAGICFSQKSLNRIRIKGADLSNAILDSTDLRDADLREVSLRGAWLNNAKLGGALMKKVEFGELPYLESEESIGCIAYSPDGKFLAAGSNAGVIRLWEFATGKWIAILNGHTNGVFSVAFSSSGNCLAYGSADNSVRLWDTKNQKSLGVLNGHTSRVKSVAFSPDGSCLASAGSLDNSVRLWDVKTQQCLTVLNGHTNFVSSVAFSPDGSCLASGSWDKTVHLWDIKNRKKLGELDHSDGYVLSVAFSPDGSCLASGSADNSVRLWDVKTQQCLTVLNGHTGDVNSVVFSPDGSCLASGSGDSTVRLWDTKNQKSLKMLNGDTSIIMSVAFSPDGKVLASGNVDNSVRLWDAKNQKSLGVLNGHTNGVFSVALSSSDNCLASGGADNSVRLWDAKNQKSLGVLNGHTSWVKSVAFSPDGSCLASAGSLDNSVRVWDVKTQQCLTVLNGHTDSVSSVAFSPDGSCLASGGEDESVRLWDAKNQKSLGVLNGHTDWVNSVAFSPDGSCLASGSEDESVRLWDAKSKKPLGVLNGHTGGVNSVVFSPDGRYLASRSMDQSVRLWDVKTEKCLNILKLTSVAMDLTFKKEGEKTCLCVASSNAIYTFETKRIQSKLDFILLWSIGNKSGLMSEQLDLGGVVGLEQQNDRLLKQREAVGVLSTKETDKVLEARSQPVPYDPKQPPYDLFSATHLIMPRNAMVSMVRKKGTKHAFLVIESIQENHYILTRADFVIDLRQKHSMGRILSSGQALIEVCVKPLADMQELASQCVYQSWKITDDQASALLANLEADRSKRINYLSLGNSSLYHKSHEETHNCLTWCEGHLSNIGIDVSQQKSWFDAIAVDPTRHLPDKESTPNTMQNVSISPQGEKPPRPTNRLPLPPPERRARAQDNTSNSVKPSLRESDEKDNEADSKEKCLMM